jgi:1,4-alpha-glucan branching enzyme
MLSLLLLSATVLGCATSASVIAPATYPYSTKSAGVLGNIPYPAGGPYTGVTFRVWVPSATAVYATGQFNNWGTTAMYQETPGGVWNDYWSIDIPGATTGQQYLYKITANGSSINFRDPNARLVTKAAYVGGNSITYDPAKYSWGHTSPTTTTSLNKLVIYEMHIGTFNATTSSPGTFQSAINELSSIQNLGFNAIELIPIGQFDGILTNPYNPTDPYAVDNDEYGGPDNLKAFIDAAHAKGISVILDVVHSFWNASHDSSVYDWESSDSSGYPDGEYFYDSTRYIGHWGSRPDYSTPAIGFSSGYIANEMNMWVNEYHMDGFRWDSIGNIYNTCAGGVGTCGGSTGVSLPDGITLMQDINNSESGLFKFAEDITGGTQEHYDTLALSAGQPNLGFDSQWNATLAALFDRDMPGTAKFPIVDLEQILSPTSFWNGVGLHDINYVQSHDELTTNNSRLIELIDGNTTGAPPSLVALKKDTLAASILFTTPGIPMVYQGDEFLDYSIFDHTTPLKWSNETTYSGIVSLYTNLIAARVNNATSTPGLSDPDINVFHEDSTNDVVAWDRYSSSSPCGDDVVVVANLSPSDMVSTYRIGLPCAGTWKVVFNSDSSAYSSSFGNIGPSEGSTFSAVNVTWDGLSYTTTLAIGKFSLIILTK